MKKFKQNNYFHGLSYTKEYILWKKIKQRCYNKKDCNFKYYGGRGIRMYKLWYNNPILFCNYIKNILGPKPSINHSLDRINNNNHYTPGNLRWATRSEQNKNRRNFVCGK